MSDSISSARVEVSPTEPLVLSNGIRGIPRAIQSYTPEHYADIVADRRTGSIALNAQAFFPEGNPGPVPMVILAPGSTGINTAHLKHAATLTSIGIGACVLDSFGPRGVSHTYHDQRLLTYSAGTYDVLAAAAHLMEWDRIDPRRIGATGPSRGGTAVLQAAMRPLADAVMGPDRALRAVLPMYPSGVFQFYAPDTGNTRIGIAMGDRDRWTLLSTVQGYARAIRLCGGDVRVTVWPDAEHSFDREDVPLMYVEAGVEATMAPIYYLTERGYFCDSNGENEDLALTEKTLRERIHERYGRQGSWLGSQPGQPESFTAFLKTFFAESFGMSDRR
ncbi:dienelactone hydrolase family protein [Bordetella bronchiseptica]|nr:dienelactone hydrolase family protein [Bordetella bronchiseptica]KCV27731.1 dienelactone hydrolase family protein [Bordetella bronchiseptica 00-P-2730]SHS63175.1 Dienelactone hydrolase family [Mycobacteroides abscessus subsp. abscessus]KCV30945.1 dienelactone hydrolase family protein [Bordetella bronchiseptica 00-P-2796]KDB68416.1 dienelactone hydrolase family protein [Bordetella bronchiseptica A1-7]KDB95062.1 dienelactone hydrolase family protein [Bordetella bronchiseptica D993]